MITKILFLEKKFDDSIDFIKLISKIQQNPFWEIFLAGYNAGGRSWHDIAQSLLTAQRFIELDGCGIDPPTITAVGCGNLADYFKSISKFGKDHEGEYWDMPSIEVDYISNSGKKYQYVFSFDKYANSDKVELRFPEESSLSHWENAFWNTFINI